MFGIKQLIYSENDLDFFLKYHAYVSKYETISAPKASNDIVFRYQSDDVF